VVRDSICLDFYFFQDINKFNLWFSPAGDVDVSTALHLIPEIGGNDFTYAYTAGLSPAAANSKLIDEVLNAVKQSLEVKRTAFAFSPQSWSHAIMLHAHGDLW